MAETYFIREKKEQNFTIVDNTFIRDCNLSWKAKGVMVYLLSLPEDWKIYKSEVQKHATDGKDSLTSAINELKEHGYIVTENIKNDKGQFAGTIYKVVEKPLTENPTAVKPIAENQTLLNTNNTNNLNTKYLNNNISKKTKKEFIPPTVDEVRQYCKEKNYNIDAEQFISYYESNNWKDKNNAPVKNWKLKLVVWSKNTTSQPKKQGSMINQLGVDDINIKEEDIPF